MRSKKAYIIDMYSHGSYHEVINQGLLMMVASLYDSVIYVADGSSVQNMKKLLDSCEFNYQNVVFREVSTLVTGKTGHPSIDYFIYILMRSMLNYYHYMKTDKGCDVFYNNNLYFATFFITLFSFGKSNRIFDVCHNEMEDIDKQHVNTNIGKFMHAYLYTFFCKMKVGEKFKFILLSESMAEYFKSFIPERNHHAITWMDHPYIRSESKETKDNVTGLKEGLKIGIPGYISPARGLNELKEVLARLKNPMVNVYSISVVSEKIESSQFFMLNNTRKLLPFADYVNCVKKMDALILLYRQGSYRLTASGAILEAIWNEKPVYAIENAYFSYLFDKFGALGKLFKSTEELGDYLNTLDVGQTKEYEINLHHARESLHPWQVMERLSEIVEEQ